MTNHGYEAAPTSPNHHAGNRTMEVYYSAPTSPHAGSGQTSDFDFEFGTSKNFSYYETSPEFFNSQRFDDRFFEKQKAFADELFVDGLAMMPLKLPPRLQHDGYSSSSNFSPNILSPKSPTTACRLPFSRKNSSWNFDPFAVALEKVREEKRGGNYGSTTAAAANDHHKRSRSYSPFRVFVSSSSDNNVNGNPEKEIQEPERDFKGPPLDFKGSVYARWVRDQTQRRGALGENREVKSRRRMLSFLAKKVRPLRNEQEGLEKVGSVGEKRGGDGGGKMTKLRDVLVRYALLRKEGKGGSNKKAIKGR